MNSRMLAGTQVLQHFGETLNETGRVTEALEVRS